MIGEKKSKIWFDLHTKALEMVIGLFCQSYLISKYVDEKSNIFELSSKESNKDTFTLKKCHFHTKITNVHKPT